MRPLKKRPACVRLSIAVMHPSTQWCSPVKEVTAKVEKIKVRTLTWDVLFSLHSIL